MSVRRPVEGTSSPGTEGTGCWEPPEVGVGNQTAEPSLQSQYPALSSGSRHSLEAKRDMGSCEYREGLGPACTPSPLPCLLVLLGTKRLRGHDGAVTGLSWAAVEVLVQMPDSQAVGETDHPAPASASGVLDYRCAQPLMPDAGLRKEGPSLSLSWKSAQPSARNRAGHTGSPCLFVRGVAVGQRGSQGCPGWDKSKFPRPEGDLQWHSQRTSLSCFFYTIVERTRQPQTCPICSHRCKNTTHLNTLPAPPPDLTR